MSQLAVRECREEFALHNGGLSEADDHIELAKSSKWKAMLLSLLVVCFNSVGNLALAWGMKSLPEVMGWNPVSYVAAMLNPFVFSGVVLLILWLLTRMMLMSWADLSFALPLMALGYVMAAVLGKFVLHETVTGRQWVGTLLIFAGIALVSSTSHQTSLATAAWKDQER